MNSFRFYADKFGLQLRQNSSLNKLFRKSYATKKGRKQEKPTAKALEHFDDLYKGIFKTRWRSIRLGLLSKSKHVVLLNNFANIAETEEFLKCRGALDLRAFAVESESNSEDDTEQELDNGNVKQQLAENEIIQIDDDAKGKEVVKAFNPKRCDDKIKQLFKEYEVQTDDSTEDEQLRSGIVDTDKSMSEALAESQFDTSRIIDPSQGLDSLHDFVPVSQIKGQEEYVLEGDYYRFYKVNSDFPVNIENELELEIPKNLKVYSFPRGDVSTFPSPKISTTGVYDYYALDGASILVVLALGLQPGDIVFDMCAAPGGKSLTILQTMLPEHLVCNDSSISRCNRMYNVFSQYLHDYPDEWRNSVSVTSRTGQDYVSNHKFNKILVDVPCTTDRISATIDENNIFKGRRTKERLKLPEYQMGLLENALKLVQPGGTVVYSTCTMSPMQNDAVVNLALQKVWREHQIEFTVRNLNPALNRLKHFYRFASSETVKYGTLVLPFVPVNFGPMYFCKLVRNM